MDLSEEQLHCTPKKLLSHQCSHMYHPKLSSPATFKFINQFSVMKTPQTKFIRSSPVSSNQNESKNLSKTSVFHKFPVMNTPPSRQRLTKILNPFESALTERLHLPLIGSPSLFQRPATPQHSSTQFEWTIEEVSSLGPANVEPHETQFLGDSIDPDVEAKAQAAISSYFKENQIVPSPQNCPIRTKRIVLAENMNSYSTNSKTDEPSPFIIKSTKRIRDSYTQTVLTLPPILPIELEEILKPYFQYTENQQQTPDNKNCDKNLSIDYDAKDASLRRKLFHFPDNLSDHEDNTYNDDPDSIDCDVFSPPPKTPELKAPVLSTRHSCGSIKERSFGALSPISKLSTTPEQNYSVLKKFDQDNSSFGKISPTKCSSRTSLISINKLKKSLSSHSIYQSSAEENKLLKTSSSPNLSRMSVDTTFNAKINQLLVHSFNSSKKSNCNNIEIDEHIDIGSKSLNDIDLFNQSDFISFSYGEPDDGDDDAMLISQLSSKSIFSTTSRSTSADTPRRRRSLGRKNLSQSFSCHFSDTDDDTDNETGNDVKKNLENIVKNNQENNGEKPLIKRRSPNNIANSNIQSEIFQVVENSKNLPNHNEFLKIYRTDSGFNEMSSSSLDVQDEMKFTCMKSNDLNQIMTANEQNVVICCSTPSRKQHNQ